MVNKMRVTQGDMLNKPLIDVELNDGTHVETPFDLQEKRYKRDKMCIIVGFIITNGLSFITGYLIKEKFMNDDWLDGSLSIT